MSCAKVVSLFEVFAVGELGRRRTWSAAKKIRIVKESYLGYAIFLGTRVSKNFVSPRPSRYCPACLESDGLEPAWRQRLIWGVRHVHRCARALAGSG